MDIQQYYYIFKRWAWWVLLGAVIGAAIGITVSYNQISVYQTSTKVMVSSASNGLAANPYAIYTDQILAQTYVQILTTQPMLDKAGEHLGYSVSRGQVSAAAVDERSPIINISVTDADPQRAADIANQMVLVLIEQNGTLQSGQYAASEETLQAQILQVEQQIAKLQSDLDNQNTKSLSEQIAQVEVQMQPLREEVSQIHQELVLITPAYSAEQKLKRVELESRLAEIEPLLNLYQEIYSNLVVLGSPGTSVENNSLVITRLQSTLALYQQIYLNLINSREAIRLARLQNTPNVVQIEPASVPVKPIRPRHVNDTLAGAGLGFLLIAGIAFLIEYLDDTIKTSEDVERVLGIPVLGYIAAMENTSGNHEGYLFVREQPRSPISEAFRSLRINLEFAGVDKPMRSILVTSPGPGEGKTTVSANLASIIAQAGKSSILVDADMRRPRIHKLLGVSNHKGLSDLFVEHNDLRSAYADWDKESNMRVVTSGNMPPNPAELLGSEKMIEILGQLSAAADMVVIDSPPTVVADAQSLASKVDGIIVVIHPGHTRVGAATAAVEQFRRVGGHLLGVVFNRISMDNTHYYGGYYYYTYNYYTSAQEKSPAGFLSGFKRRDSQKPASVRVEPVQEPQSESVTLAELMASDPAFEAQAVELKPKGKRSNGNGKGNGHGKLKPGAPLGTDYLLKIHKVDPGEKLISIASMDGSSVSAISAVNYNFSTPIKPDQMIVVPINQTDAHKLPPFEPYESSEEISVEELAKTLKVDADNLKYYNGLGNGYRLSEGDWIVVPRGKA